MKRLLVLTAVIVLLTFGVCAEVVGGSCGENTGWYLDTETGLFCLVGKGDMTDYNHPYAALADTPPWYGYRAFIKTVEISEGITSGVLSKWIKCYKINGYNGLDMKKGRPCKEIPMKKDNLQIELAPSEREELIRLRAETEYLRAENEAIKKSIALRQEKEAARLKAKKQQSLKRLGKKDLN